MMLILLSYNRLLLSNLIHDLQGSTILFDLTFVSNVIPHSPMPITSLQNRRPGWLSWKHLSCQCNCTV